MLKKITIAAALTLAATSAFADNKIGVMYIPSSDFEIDGDELDGDGFGVYGQFDVSATSFITVEYTATEQDFTVQDPDIGDIDVESEIDQIRVGFGNYFQLSSPQLKTMLHVEVVNFEPLIEATNGNTTFTFLDESETGVGLHAGMNFAASTQVSLFAQIGYLSIDELDGPEFKLGLNVKANEQFSFFADYRASRFEADNDTDVDVDDMRLGAALHF